ncbi:oxidoreductase [Hyaloscypha sp. PMI_1271]|nr:oxidoreductase [Hyaloscypha sp. PMI_1271]
MSSICQGFGDVILILLTYRPLHSFQNVLVIGGSFTSIWLARRLTESLSSGYKVVLAEKNSHFNYTFNFPRYSLLRGHEQKAFIPYQGLFEKAPEGIFEDGEIELASGKCVPYAYLAIATGATQSPPAKLLASQKGEAGAELRVLQARVEKAEKVAIVGGGAVGVQLSVDIESFYKDKTVVLIHLRDQLLSSFGVRLHEFVVGKLGALGVDVWLGERPTVPVDGNWESEELTFKCGRSEMFDLVIPCTGQKPNSSIITEFSPLSISTQAKWILAKPTLQLEADVKSNERMARIFALGDVAGTGGPMMARAGMLQAETVLENIVALIQRKKLAENTSLARRSVEVEFGQGKSGNVDLEAAKVWKMFGADLQKKGIE